MKIFVIVAIFVDQILRGLVDNKLRLEAITVCGLVVCVGKMSDRDALRANLFANPVRVGQVDADCRRRIQIAAQDGRRNNLCRNTFYLFFLETRIYGRMILKPLCVFTEFLRALCSCDVLKVDNSLPRCLQAERVSVRLRETIDKVDQILGSVNPKRRVFVESAEVARAIKLDELIDYGLLRRCVAIGARLLEIVDDFRDRTAVKSVFAPYEFG